MGKLNQDFTTWKGNYRQIVFYIDDVSTVTGGTAEWAMSIGNTGTTLILKTSDPTSGITLSGKYVTVTLNPTDTGEASSIPAGSYYHELRLVDVVGQPTTPAIGTVTLYPVIIKT